MGLAYSPLVADRPARGAAGDPGRGHERAPLSDSLGTALGTGLGGAIVAASVRRPALGPGLAAAFGVAVAVGLGGLLLTGAAAAARPVAAPGPGRAEPPAAAGVVDWPARLR